MQARLAAVSRCFDFESFHRHSFAAMSFDADPCGWTDPALPVEFIQRHGSRSGLIGRVHHQKIKRRRNCAKREHGLRPDIGPHRSEEHTSELQSLMRISYAVFCLKKKNIQ